jgi:hypothetical protein
MRNSKREMLNAKGEMRDAKSAEESSRRAILSLAASLFGTVGNSPEKSIPK